MSHEATIDRSKREGIIFLAIAAGGILTLISAVLALPIGIALSVTSAVLAVVTHGVKRKLLAAIASSGAVLCATIALSLLATRF